jgi:hypothetical protein
MGVALARGGDLGRSMPYLLEWWQLYVTHIDVSKSKCTRREVTCGTHRVARIGIQSYSSFQNFVNNVIDINVVRIHSMESLQSGHYAKDTGASLLKDRFRPHQENSWPLSSTELYLEFLIK